MECIFRLVTKFFEECEWFFCSIQILLCIRVYESDLIVSLHAETNSD